MKKFFPFFMILLAVICIVPLVSCSDDGPRTTITREEWDAFYYADNVTLTMTVYSEGQETIVKQRCAEGVICTCPTDDELKDYIDSIFGSGFFDSYVDSNGTSSGNGDLVQDPACSGGNKVIFVTPEVNETYVPSDLPHDSVIYNPTIGGGAYDLPDYGDKYVATLPLYDEDESYKDKSGNKFYMPMYFISFSPSPCMKTHNDKVYEPIFLYDKNEVLHQKWIRSKNPVSPIDISLSDLTYDENEKAYYYIGNLYDGVEYGFTKIYYYFENGKIVKSVIFSETVDNIDVSVCTPSDLGKGKYISGLIEYSDFGTTKTSHTFNEADIVTKEIKLP